MQSLQLRFDQGRMATPGCDTVCGASGTLPSCGRSHLCELPIRFGSSASMVNAAIEAFVHTATIDMPRGIRINSVSPNVFQESMPGYAP